MNPAPKLENLAPPWQPGQSGNPGGKRATKPLTDSLRAALEEPHGKKGITKREAMIDRLLTIALTGKRGEALQAMKLIFAYSDGLPTQPIELEIQRAAERIASATGSDPDWLVKRAQEIAAEAVAG